MEKETVDRTYDVFGNITQEMAQDFLQWCIAISSNDLLYKLTAGDNCELLPVVINISSLGGECDALDTMLDAIQLLECPIITRAFGQCMSCALHLFVEGDVRSCGDYTTFLYHDTAYKLEGKAWEHEEQLQAILKSQHRYDARMIKRTNMTMDDILSNRKIEWEFDKAQAIKLGIVNYDDQTSALLSVVKYHSGLEDE